MNQLIWQLFSILANRWCHLKRTPDCFRVKDLISLRLSSNIFSKTTDSISIFQKTKNVKVACSKQNYVLLINNSSIIQWKRNIHKCKIFPGVNVTTNSPQDQTVQNLKYQQTTQELQLYLCIPQLWPNFIVFFVCSSFVFIFKYKCSSVFLCFCPPPLTCFCLSHWQVSLFLSWASHMFCITLVFLLFWVFVRNIEVKQGAQNKN